MPVTKASSSPCLWSFSYSVLCVFFISYFYWSLIALQCGVSLHYTSMWISCVLAVVQWLNVSNSFLPHGPQRSRFTCPSPSLGACSNTCALSQWCHPTILSSSCPQSFPASGSLSSESALHIRWPKYWSFGFSINPSNENSGLIFLRIHWFHLLAVQGTLKSLLQHFKTINSSTVSLLNGLALTSIHDYWKNHSFD